MYLFVVCQASQASDNTMQRLVASDGRQENDPRYHSACPDRDIARALKHSPRRPAPQPNMADFAAERKAWKQEIDDAKTELQGIREAKEKFVQENVALKKALEEEKVFWVSAKAWWVPLQQRSIF